MSKTSSKPLISEAFRRSMNDVHTWFGILVGGLLFLIFWMGTMSVFDHNIDQWMKPEWRGTLPSDYSIDTVVAQAQQQTFADHSQIFIHLPEPVLPLVAITGFSGVDQTRKQLYFDPVSGEEIPVTDSLAATQFLYPFHFELHLHWKNIGIWIVGAAAMAMMTLVVSGVFIHRKIFADFFTFRPTRQLRRSTLDLHNLTGVVALPFHFIFPLTGLIIFFGTYLPWAIEAPFGGDETALMQEGGYRPFHLEAAGVPDDRTASLADMISDAENSWQTRLGVAEPVHSLVVHNLGDANAYVAVSGSPASNRVTTGTSQRFYNANTGVLLFDYFEERPMRTAEGWLMALHYVHFDHWPLKWLVFFGGLSSCVMIASGNLFWMRARISKSGAQTAGVIVVRGLTIGAVTGLIAATAAFFAVNKALPANAAALGLDRSELEVVAFFLVWIAAFIHAFMRPDRAWKEQCAAIGCLCFLATGLNWLTSGHHFFAAAQLKLWSVIGMDASLIVSGVIAFWIAMRIKTKISIVVSSKVAAPDITFSATAK